MGHKCNWNVCCFERWKGFTVNHGILLCKLENYDGGTFKLVLYLFMWYGRVFRTIMFYLVIWLRKTVPFWIFFHHIKIILKYLCIEEDKNLESLKQVYYPIIKFYLLIQIYFFSLRLKCALKTPSVHFPKSNCGTDKKELQNQDLKFHIALLF